MHNQSKINLIYVASIGHSGSTLLESMLGAHSQIATCGEIHILPHEIAERSVMPCSCGKSIVDCQFWSQIQQKVNPLQQNRPQVHFSENNIMPVKRLDSKDSMILATENSIPQLRRKSEPTVKITTNCSSHFWT